MKNSSNIVLGILGAAAAGVVIGMIIAPQKGSEFRSNLKSSAGDLTKRLGDLLSKGKKKYDELRELMGEEGTELRQDAKNLVDDAGNAYKEFSGKAEDAYNELSQGAKQAYKKSKS